jgi:hypothetical protein
MSYIYAYTTMSTPQQRILRSGAVSTPVDSVPLSLPRCSPRGHQSTVEETAAVLFAGDDKHEDDVVPAATNEKGEANKKRTSKQAGAAPTKKRNKKSAEESSMKEKRKANFSQDKDFMLCCAYVNASVDPIIGVAWGMVPSAVATSAYSLW